MENFVEFANDLVCYAPPNDDDIITRDSSDDEDVGDKDEPVAVPSVSCALDSIRKLRKSLVSKTKALRNWKKLNKLFFPNF